MLASLRENEKKVKTILVAHLVAVATKDQALLLRSFARNAMFFGSDDTEQWTLGQLAQRLEESKDGWNMKECTQRSIQSVSPDVMSFFEIVRHVKYGQFRGSGVVVKNANHDWEIAQYVLSFSVPNAVVDKTNILTLLAG